MSSPAVRSRGDWRAFFVDNTQHESTNSVWSDFSALEEVHGGKVYVSKSPLMYVDIFLGMAGWFQFAPSKPTRMFAWRQWRASVGDPYAIEQHYIAFGYTLGEETYVFKVFPDKGRMHILAPHDPLPL